MPDPTPAKASHEATIQQLILAAAEGAAAGIQAIDAADPKIPVELDEFEIEVTYSCTTDFDAGLEAGAQFKFGIVASEINVKTSYHRKVAYGLRIGFRFVGTKPV